jgi:hypothetical protein
MRKFPEPLSLAYGAFGATILSGSLIRFTTTGSEATRARV